MNVEKISGPLRGPPSRLEKLTVCRKSTGQNLLSGGPSLSEHSERDVRRIILKEPSPERTLGEDGSNEEDEGESEDMEEGFVVWNERNF